MHLEDAGFLIYIEISAHIADVPLAQGKPPLDRPCSILGTNYELVARMFHLVMQLCALG